ncbi:MAG: DUF2723 domain-containing protein [Chloroflexi bacterium]|nr:DUF2723 domain-containing protein [Chloroflexota bacterium]
MARKSWPAVLVFLAALALYARTLAPSVAELFDDSLEFQLVGYTLAIAHPTGYPLYTLLLKAATVLPSGDPAYRANLLSAVCAGLAVALIYLVAARLSGSRLAGLVSAAALAVSPVFWSQAVIAEVYALNALFYGVILLAALPSEDGAHAGFGAKLAPLAFLFGLALTHHRMIVLLGFGVAVATLWQWVAAGGGRVLPAWPRLLREGGRLALLFAAPLLLYLYLPLRGSVGSLDGTYENTPGGFVRWVTASGYTSFLSENLFNVHYDAAYFANLFAGQFGLVGSTLAVLGVVVWAARVPRWRQPPAVTSACLLTALAACVAFVLDYRVPDVQVFAIPAFMLLALALGVGFAWLAARAGSHARLAQVALVALLVVSGVPVAQAAWVENDLSGRTGPRDYGRDIVSQPLPPNASLVGILGEMTLVRYFQATEGAQPSLVTVAADRDAERLAAIERELAAGRTVFTTRPLKGLAEAHALGAAGPLVRVWAVPPDADVPPDAPRVGAIRYRFDGVQWLGGRGARASLTWAPDATPDVDLKVSARLMRGDLLVAQKDDWPVRSAYRSQFWRPGTAIADAYDVALPQDAPSGDYRLLLIIYRADSGAELGRIDAGTLKLGRDFRLISQAIWAQKVGELQVIVPKGLLQHGHVLLQ